MKKLVFSVVFLTLVGADRNCPDEETCGNNTLNSQEECDDGNTLDGDGCSSECTLEIVACTTDVTSCPDGTLVGRSGPDCEFDCSDHMDEDEEGEVIIPCQTDAPMCPDGSVGMRFPPLCEVTCPEVEEEEEEEEVMPVVCTTDAHMCPDGTWIGRSGPQCVFDCSEHQSDDEGEEPMPIVCSADLGICPDGTGVPRSGPNCEFDCTNHQIEVDSSVEDCGLGESIIPAGGFANEATFGEITTFSVCTNEGVQPDFAYVDDIDDNSVPDVAAFCDHSEAGQLFNQNYDPVSFSDWGCHRYCTCSVEGDLMCTPYIMCIN